MDSFGLFRKIIESPTLGADEAGIKDRFGDNYALYEKCLREFVENPKHSLFEEAIELRDYKGAFDAAHSLKGISGNLGLTNYYNALYKLVETLRAEDYTNLPSEYSELKVHFDEIKSIYGGTEESARGKSEKKAKSFKLRFFLVGLGAVILVLAILLFAFGRIKATFRMKSLHESGQHLTETGFQIKLYLEEQFENDRKIIKSLEQAITTESITLNDENYMAMLRYQREEWGVTDLLLYTENGYCISSENKVDANDAASEVIVKARADGYLVSIIDSKITFTIPIYTSNRYNGSPIAAISVVRSMESFLDDMGLNSFGNEAWMYLADEQGIVISMLSVTDSAFTFNIRTLFNDAEISPLGSADAGELFTSGNTDSFYVKGMSDGGDDKYVVSVPIRTGAPDKSENSMLRLLYIVSEKVVNGRLNEFSTHLTLFSAVVIILFLIASAVSFYIIYKERNKKFASEITAREHMFDLLIRNMRAVFLLLNTDRDSPLYISDNASRVLDFTDGGTLYLSHNEAGYSVRCSSPDESDTLKQINTLLHGWDGLGVFRSTYFRGRSKLNPTYYELILYPVVDTEATRTGKDFVGIIEDVTSEHDREEITRNAMEMAKRSSEAKTLFLANMSHDIRTPMNAVMNMSAFALECVGNGDSEKLREYLKTIYDSSKHLLQLINDVLDMSRIESGQTVIASEPFELKAELTKLYDEIKPLCDAKKQRFECDFKRVYSGSVRGDALKLSQVMINLLSNAVKFTPEDGLVSITAEEIPSLLDDAVEMRFIVRDNGIGIADKNLDMVFEPFSRVDDSIVRSVEGTGLGLSICRNYVEAMGGVIYCESKLGEGSSFTVELSFERAEASGKKEELAIDSENEYPFSGLRCLVVEDIAINQVVAKTLLEKVGFEVVLAGDGEEGARLFIESEPGYYNVIYMDIQMPVLNGYLAAEKIRVSSHPDAVSVPIIAMSANVYSDDIEKARVAGMDGYIGKPIVSSDLIEQTYKAIKIKKEKG